MKLINETLTLQASSNEETGIVTEMIICNILDIECSTKRNVEFEIPEKMKEDIENSSYYMLHNLDLASHEGGKNNYYDFLTTAGDSVSLKTNTSGSKICPQSIGQVSVKKFSEKTKFKNITSNDDYKKLIFDNTQEVISEYLDNLFCCKYLLYIQYNTGLIVLFTKNDSPVQIDNLEYTFSQPLETWKESSTLHTSFGSLAEFQVHNNRNCVKCRFDINTLLKLIEAGIIKNVKITKKQLHYTYNIKVNPDTAPKLCEIASNQVTKLPLKTFNYIGSKLKLVDFISEVITSFTGYKSIAEIDSFADLFSGTGAVSYYILSQGCKSIISSDIQHYSYIISSVLTTKNINVDKVKGIIQSLNGKVTEEPYEHDFVYHNYTDLAERNYLTLENGLRVDRIRQQIETFKNDTIITTEEYQLLIKILLYAVTRVSNITSVYGAYLKKFKKSALKELLLDDTNILDSLLPDTNTNHISMHGSVNQVLKQLDTSKLDVVYLDPPYNHRTYSANYHVLETISKYDYPSLKGKTGLRDEENDESKLFCSKRTCAKEFEKITSMIKSKYLFISYSSEGIVSKDAFITLLSKNWNDVVCHTKDYQRFKSNDVDTKSSQTLEEYIFCCKNKKTL